MLLLSFIYNSTRQHQADKLQTWGMMDGSEICLDNDVSKAGIISEACCIPKCVYI